MAAHSQATGHTDIEYISLRRGKRVFQLVKMNGYTYSKNTGKCGPGNLWLCSKYKRGKCPAKFRVIGDKVIYYTVNHTHQPPVLKKALDGVYQIY
ncbi:unnamed protein product [Pieris macdunnoughi]|uniref:FLYWCH-type domain-containing protein n=1 Tax=Pieris macdunnoughi TaxID=345717 RepID=A0A821Q627_9NEOP|nr:unnamed protein product [Pieris macdunnoughi]